MPTTESQLNAIISGFFNPTNTVLNDTEHETMVLAFKDWVKTELAALAGTMTNPAQDYLSGGVDVVAIVPSVTLSGIQTIDGVTGYDGLRVLVPNLTAAAGRTPWIMRPGAWERITTPLLNGTLVKVALGDVYGGGEFQVSFPGSYTAGTTALTWKYVGGAKLKMPSLTFETGWAVCNLTDATYAVVVDNPTSGTAKPLPAGAVLKGVFNQSTSKYYQSFTYQSNTGRVEVGEALGLGDVLKLEYAYAAPAAALPQTALTDGGFVADIEAVGVPNGARQVDEANRLVLEKYDDTRVVEYAARIRTL
jgi:hypothetical protein